MRNLPATQSKADYLVDQRNRYFAFSQALSLFGSIQNTRVYLPYTMYDNVTPGYRDVSGNGFTFTVAGTATVGTDGAINQGQYPGANDYHQIGDSAHLEAAYPGAACWCRNDGDNSVLRYMLIRGFTVGQQVWEFGFGSGATANLVRVNFSTDGTNSFVVTAPLPPDQTKWNFYAFQLRSANICNIFVNDVMTVTDPALPAAVFQTSTEGLRIGWRINGAIALPVMFAGGGANIPQRILALYYHSRYAFRDDWT